MSEPAVPWIVGQVRNVKQVWDGEAWIPLPDVATDGTCWPVFAGVDASALIGRKFSSGCPTCGHLVVLHSESKGCIGCQLLATDGQP